MEKISRIHFLSRADKLKPVRDAARQLVIAQGGNEDNVDCIVMAINEACMNVIQHAYKQQDDGEVILEFWQDDEELVIRIYDFADKVDVNNIHPRPLDDIRPGGLGVHLIHKVMDTVAYIDRSGNEGNLLEMRKKLSDSIQCDINCKDKI